MIIRAKHVLGWYGSVVLARSWNGLQVPWSSAPNERDSGENTEARLVLVCGVGGAQLIRHRAGRKG